MKVLIRSQFHFIIQITFEHLGQHVKSETTDVFFYPSAVNL